jgi:hypothetical protein
LTDLLRRTLTDRDFIDAHRQRPQDFTRQRALPFATVVTWLLLNFQSSMRQALQRLLDDLSGGRQSAVTKGALTQARAKLKPSALIALNASIVRHAEQGGRLARWMGHRLLAVDGSSLRLQAFAELAKAFGGLRHERGLRPLARVSFAFDVLNRMVVSAALAPWKQGERALFAQQLDAMGAGDMMLFDRGYPALWLFALVRSRGAHSCARIDAGLWSRAFDLLVNDTRELCYVAHLTERARRVCGEFGVECASLRLRIVRVRLATGEQEYLVTSLCDAERYPLHLFGDLYARRWAVEEGYKQLKCRLTAENFSGKSALAVEQDFHARVLLMNLTNLFVLEADRRIDKRCAHREHRYQTNRHYALAQVRRWLPRLLLGRATVTLVAMILRRLSSEPEAVRPERSYPREPRPLQRGYPFAYKAVA